MNCRKFKKKHLAFHKNYNIQQYVSPLKKMIKISRVKTVLPGKMVANEKKEVNM